MGTSKNGKVDPADGKSDEDRQDKVVVSIRTLEHGTVAKIAANNALSHFVYLWDYRLSARMRWKGQSELSTQVRELATEDFASLGIDNSVLKKLAKAGVVEISIPARDDYWTYRASSIPWEFLIGAATETFRGDLPICVVRHLDVSSIPKSARPTNKKRKAKRFAFVETAPNDFRNIKTYDAERELIRSSFAQGGIALKEVCNLTDPTAASLRSALLNRGQSPSPDLIHVTGIDAHRGHNHPELTRKHEKEADCEGDGIFFATSRAGKDELLRPNEIGKRLTAGTPNPLLIGFNAWHSGSTIAPWSIASGAEAAIGFQNNYDDFVAEMFYANFYQAWLESDQDLLSAFLQTLIAISPFKEKVKGSVVILWSATSFFTKSRPKNHITANLKGMREAVHKFNTRKASRKTNSRKADPQKDRIEDLVGIKVNPIDKINYSLLHNRRGVMEELSFWLKRPSGEAILGDDCYCEELPVGDEFSQIPLEVHDIEVEVGLMVGSESFPYRTRISLNDYQPRIDLADFNLKATDTNPGGGIQVPLISHLARSIDERMQTSLYVNVTWHGQTLYRHTHSVSLTPVDEWHLSDEDIFWIPSFVFPRDPAVAKIISSAQPFLRCLTDDPQMGFVGYQSGAGFVEEQVSAIWQAITLEYEVNYICPPPSYTTNTQRLRSPSQVIGEKHGTCVDLALLFVSCLEWIELFPVIFQTEIHSFAGYWVSEEARDEFLAVRKATDNKRKDSNRKKDQTHFYASHSPRLAELPWVSPKFAYAEIREHVLDDKLIPIECISLTENVGFNKAWTAAREYFLYSRKEVREVKAYHTARINDVAKFESRLTRCEKLIETLKTKKTKKATASLRRKRHELKQIKIDLAQERDYLDDSDEELQVFTDNRCTADGEINPETKAHGIVDNFHSMIDIGTARNFVTPLPLVKPK